jgi:predicted AAA+ superfamily ATPase
VRYQRRLVDDQLDDLFPHLAAVALEGAKGVGKTATATRRARSTLTLTNPRERSALAGNLGLIEDLEPPLFIDEWQLEPPVWDMVRHAVDADPSGGRFLLAGSASTPPGARIHSGAGRIVAFRMRPLSWFERGVSSQTVSLRELLGGGRPAVTGESQIGPNGYLDEILRSGFPVIRDLPERARDAQLDSYIARITDRELVANGTRVRRPEAMLAWLRAYAAATATDANYEAILDAATPGEANKPSGETVRSYREALRRLFVLDPVPAWIPSFAPLRRLTKGPKHHLVDPALAARLVGVGLAGLLRGDGDVVAPAGATWLGALFESLVTQSVRVYAEAAGATVSHLRTKGGEQEIDLIAETRDLRVLAIEVKASETVGRRDARHLDWLQSRLGDRLADKIVVHTGPFAYRDADGTAVVPFSLLGP